MTIFGPLVANTDVENAATTTLELWLPAYLAEIERQKTYAGGLDYLARPRSWQAAYDFDNWNEGQFPAVVVVCNGTSSLERAGAGVYEAWFEVVVGCLVTDESELLARRVTHLYQAAIEGVMVQKGSLGGFASETILLGRQTRLPNTENRVLAVAESTFHVFVENVVQRSAGPALPPSPSDAVVPDRPEVLTTDTTFTAVNTLP